MWVVVKTQKATHGAGSPARRLSSIAFLSAATRQNVSTAIVGRKVMPEMVMGSLCWDFVFLLCFASSMSVEGVSSDTSVEEAVEGLRREDEEVLTRVQ